MQWLAITHSNLYPGYYQYHALWLPNNTGIKNVNVEFSVCYEIYGN